MTPGGSDAPPTRPKVFVVQPIMDVGRLALEEVADVEVHDSDRMIPRDVLLAAVRDSDYLWMLGDTPIDGEVLDAAPRLKGIATMALFPNVVDVDAATRRGLPVTVVPHVITKTTCDLTCALVLGLFWRLVEADRFVRDGRFHQEQSTSFLTRELSGKTVGMVGLGEIGAEIVGRLRAFEMDVVYTKRNRLSAERERELGVTWEPELDELLRRADVVVLMATYNATTHRLIGAREFGLMKPSAYLVNTARGRIVDEPALIDALRDRTIAGAGLDVYWTEPPVGEPSPSRELFDLPNLILTPHIGSATVEAREAMALAVVENLRAMIAGERPPHVVNPEVYGEEALARSDRLG
ncbi:MAG TPA: NAD(P)-dependent oxidoreductase [Actinomycetota bacterium]|nr:NAD(P)-dependent oxidoreductase [Actinomycetota bacterium]